MRTTTLISEGARRTALFLLLLLLLAIAATACARSAVLPPLLQPTAEDRGAAVPVEPPPKYRDWWRQMEACSRKSRPITSVAGWYAAVYFVESDELFFARRFLHQPFIVRHEMLHALLRIPASDSIRHPNEYFRVRCGAFVSPPHDP